MKELHLVSPELRSHCQEHLQTIQAEFDLYQNAAFVPKSPEFFCLELCGESGELANMEKKVWRGQQIEHKAIADEAADVFITLMNYCNARGIHLGEAVARKLQIIEDRRAEREKRGEIF